MVVEMGIGPNWKKWEIDQLGILIQGGLTNTEIATIMSRPVGSIQNKAHECFGGNSNYHERIKKHIHLREEVLKHFQKHSFDETALRFGLTPGQLKSCLSFAYKEGRHRHLRKDTRTHNPWTSEELIFLLRHAGLQQRSWIAEKIKRGNPRVIKERLMSLGVNTKTLNGMTLSKYRAAFNQEPRQLIETNAGPGRGGTPTYFKIVPWIEVLQDIESKRVSAPKLFHDVALAMSAFQKWIHGENVVKSMQLAASSGHEPPQINRTYKHASKEVLT